MSQDEIQLFIRSEIDKGLSELRTEMFKTISLLTSYNQSVKLASCDPVETDKQLELSFKPRITIVGLLPRQERDILKEFGDTLDIRFFTVESNRVNTLKEKIKSSEAVFVMIKFINHNISNIAKDHTNYIPVNGGMSDLQDAITNFYMEL